MVIRKRQLLWDWTNTAGPGNPGVPQEMNNVPFGGSSPMASVVNWNAWVPPELKGRAPFRPMVHGMGNTSGNDWGTIQNTPYPIILFFNEPERAGISPEQARDIWYSHMLPLRHNKGKKLGSPAVAGDSNGEAWLAKFMGLISRDPPDYLCLHYYSTDGNAAIGYIEDMHRKYPHPVMVTEIASIDRNYMSVLGFTIQLCNWMDKTDYVHEYGLFDFQRKVADGFVSPAAQLMREDGRFTQLGNMYLHDQPMRWPGHVQQGLLGDDLAQPEPTEEPSEPEMPTPPIITPEDAAKMSSDTVNGPNDTSKAESSEAEEESLVIQQPLRLDADQTEALKIQNDKRRQRGLKPLEWDHTLSAHAETWARHLTQIDKMQHSTGDQRPGEGENLAYAWSSSSVHDPMAGAAKMWMDEEKNYHGEPIGQGNFGSYGHYTQCMWHSTTKVGMATATNAKGGVYTVGRYSPPGNWSGQKPY